MVTESRADDSDEILVSRAAGGDRSARTLIVDKYRQRLRRMVSIRIDKRIAARVDASDVVQEALVEATDRSKGSGLFDWGVIPNGS